MLLLALLATWNAQIAADTFLIKNAGVSLSPELAILRTGTANKRVVVNSKFAVNETLPSGCQRQTLASRLETIQGMIRSDLIASGFETLITTPTDLENEKPSANACLLAVCPNCDECRRAVTATPLDLSDLGDGRATIALHAAPHMSKPTIKVAAESNRTLVGVRTANMLILIDICNASITDVTTFATQTALCVGFGMSRQDGAELMVKVATKHCRSCIVPYELYVDTQHRVRRSFMGLATVGDTRDAELTADKQRQAIRDQFTRETEQLREAVMKQSHMVNSSLFSELSHQQELCHVEAENTQARLRIFALKAATGAAATITACSGSGAPLELAPTAIFDLCVEAVSMTVCATLGSGFAKLMTCVADSIEITSEGVSISFGLQYPLALDAALQSYRINSIPMFKGNHSTMLTVPQDTFMFDLAGAGTSVVVTNCATNQQIPVCDEQAIDNLLTLCMEQITSSVASNKSVTAQCPLQSMYWNGRQRCALKLLQDGILVSAGEPIFATTTASGRHLLNGVKTIGPGVELVTDSSLAVSCNKIPYRIRQANTPGLIIAHPVQLDLVDAGAQTSMTASNINQLKTEVKTLNDKTLLEHNLLSATAKKSIVDSKWTTRAVAVLCTLAALLAVVAGRFVAQYARAKWVHRHEIPGRSIEFLE